MKHSRKIRIGSVLVAAVLAMPALAGQKTIPHWNSWPGTIWNATPIGEAYHNTDEIEYRPTLCEFTSKFDQQNGIELVAQSLKDCTHAGGTLSISLHSEDLVGQS